jgi:hypothetical protein
MYHTNYFHFLYGVYPLSLEEFVLGDNTNVQGIPIEYHLTSQDNEN